MLWSHVKDCVDCDDSVERSNVILLVFFLFPMVFNCIKVWEFDSFLLFLSRMTFPRTNLIITSVKQHEDIW